MTATYLEVLRLFLLLPIARAHLDCIRDRFRLWLGNYVAYSANGISNLLVIKFELTWLQEFKIGIGEEVDENSEFGKGGVGLDRIGLVSDSTCFLALIYQRCLPPCQAPEAHHIKSRASFISLPRPTHGIRIRHDYGRAKWQT